MKAVRNDYLALPADEESSYTIKFVFKDEDGNAAAPVTMVYTLMAEDGEVINSRYKVNVGVLAATTYITLYGDDLQLIDKKSVYENRVLTVEGTYNSTYGNGLPFIRQIFFRVRNVILVAIALSISTADVVYTNDYVEDVSA